VKWASGANPQGNGLGYECSAEADGELPRMWVPSEYDTIEVAEVSRLFTQVGSSTIGMQPSVDVAVRSAFDIGTLTLVPGSETGRPLGLEGVSVLVSGPQGGEARLQSLRTSEDGVATGSLAAGTYKVGLYPLAGPMVWREVTVQGGETKVVSLPVR